MRQSFALTGCLKMLIDHNFRKILSCGSHSLS
jgi:hypothetical protein